MHQRSSNVTAAQFARRFGQNRQSANNENLFITHHGRETHVLLTVENYRQLLEPSSADEPRESLPSVRELAGWIQQPFIILDNDTNIVLANQATHAMFGREDGTLVGNPIFSALPELEGTIAQSYIRRAMAARESCSAELPSLFLEDGWVRIEVYPSASNITIIVRDITEEVRRYRLADTKRALIEAMNEHGGIGYLRVNQRGRILRANSPVCGMLKLPEERFVNLDVADLVPIGMRVDFRDKLEAVLTKNASVAFDTEFLTNEGNTISIHAALIELRSVYGIEGAIIIFSQV